MRKISSTIFEPSVLVPPSSSKRLKKNSETLSTTNLTKCTAIIDDKSKFPTEGLPIKSSIVKQKYSRYLTIYEQREIVKYPDVYFIGESAKKINNNLSSNNNYGFDSPTANYKVLIGDHIKYRYEIKSILGSGVFGQVLKCYDHKDKINVALKIIINTPQMHEQGQVEATVLKKLTEEDKQNRSCCMHVYESFTFRNHICIVYEILGKSLFAFHKSINFQPYPVEILKKVVRDVLSGLLFIHLHQFVHADIKPENILFDPAALSHVKLIDFGSSCVAGKPIFNYIQSRYYRAPEIMLGLKYSTPIDLWSLGCIIAELMAGKPIFQGRNEFEQLHFYAKIIEPIPITLAKQSPRRNKYFVEGNNLIPLQGIKINVPDIPNKLQYLTNIKDPQLMDLLRRLLTIDPAKRISASLALQHPWLKEEKSNPRKLVKSVTTKSPRRRNTVK